MVKVLMVTLANAGTIIIAIPSCAGSKYNGWRGSFANLLGFELIPPYCRTPRLSVKKLINSFYIHSYSLDAFYIDSPAFVQSG